MNSYLKILVLAVIILALFHYKKYKEFNDKYQINQQELDYVNGNELYNELNPLVITFIEKISLVKNNDLDYLDMLYREKFRYGTKDEIIIKLK